MTKLPKFTLVRKPLADVDRSGTARNLVLKKSGNKPAGVSASAETKSGSARRQSNVGVRLDKLPAGQASRPSISFPNLDKVFKKLEPNFKNTVVSSFVNVDPPKKDSVKSTPHVSSSVTSNARELARHENVLRVGILDLDTWIGELPTLLEKLNPAQLLFTIFEVHAPVPGGLIKTPAGMAEWAAAHLNQPLKKKDVAQLQPQMITGDFFSAADDIRRALGLDFIVGLTPAMLAGVLPKAQGKGIYWNHFSSGLRKTILLSTTDLRQYAEQAGRPFEAAIGALLVPELLMAINKKLVYHRDSKCIFDDNVSRVNFVKTMKAMKICDSCLEKMTPEQSKAAVGMLAVLAHMKMKSK
jgi:hypothetical protein